MQSLSDDARVSPGRLDDLCLQDLQRVNVVGVSGSGKSTLARRLAKVLGSELIEMDQLYWGPNWTEPEVPVFRERLRAALTGSQWVLDGNYDSKTRDLKFELTTALVWVDLPFMPTLFQAVSRAVRRSWTKQELWPGTGNRESFRRSFFSHDSVVLWTAASYRRVRRRYRDLKGARGVKHMRYIRLRSRREIDDFIQLVSRMKSQVAQATPDRAEPV